MFKPLLLIAVAALTACAPPPTRIALQTVQSDLQLRPLVSSAMVRTVVLPTYAAAEEIPFQRPDGLIASSEDVLWADDPQRAVTLAITRHLTDILRSDIGPDPWPFAGLPDIAIDIRVESMLAGADGSFQLAGQYYIGGDGIDFRNSTHSFSISRAMPDQSLPSIAAAQSAALLTLSEDIARKIARR